MCVKVKLKKQVLILASMYLPPKSPGGGGGANQNSDSTNSALTVHC